MSEDECEECGAEYPDQARTVEGPWHEEHCSLYVERLDTYGELVGLSQESGDEDHGQRAR